MAENDQKVSKKPMPEEFRLLYEKMIEVQNNFQNSTDLYLIEEASSVESIDGKPFQTFDIYLNKGNTTYAGSMRECLIENKGKVGEKFYGLTILEKSEDGGYAIVKVVPNEANRFVCEEYKEQFYVWSESLGYQEFVINGLYDYINSHADILNLMESLIFQKINPERLQKFQKTEIKKAEKIINDDYGIYEDSSSEESQPTDE